MAMSPGSLPMRSHLSTPSHISPPKTAMPSPANTSSFPVCSILRSYASGPSTSLAQWTHRRSGLEYQGGDARKWADVESPEELGYPNMNIRLRTVGLAAVAALSVLAMAQDAISLKRVGKVGD